MSFLDMIFGGGGGGNPADAGMGYLNRIPEEVGRYYQPFISSGQEAEKITNPIYGQMSQNPQDFLNNIMRGYNPSEGYNFQRGQLENELRNTAAMGGFVGTPYHQQQQGQAIQGLLSQDMQQYLNNILGIQSGGLQGQENRIGRGYNASTGYGNIIGSNLAQQGGLAMQGAAHEQMQDMARNNARTQFFGNLLGAGAKMFGGGMF